MIPASNITDFERQKFLRKLDVEFRAKNGLMISTWEWRFLSSYLRDARPSLWFTPMRRVSTDRMWMAYAAQIEMPYPGQIVTERAKLPEADAGCCMFLVFGDDRRQTPCNAPATLQRQNGFKYCDEHAEAVQCDLKRHGKTMHLVKV